MRICFLALLLMLGACTQTPASVSGSPQLVMARSPNLSAVPACPVMHEAVRHLVELDLSARGQVATYFHRDLHTGEWMENFSVPLAIRHRLADGERVRTGTIRGFRGATFTVQWQSRQGSDMIVFPTEVALGTLLGRIVGPRGVVAHEFARTVVVAYERRCDELQPQVVG